MTFIRGRDDLVYPAVLHKYLNDELKILCLLQFFPEVAQNSLGIPWEFPELSMFREIPEYSRFYRFVTTLCPVLYTALDRQKKTAANARVWR